MKTRLTPEIIQAYTSQGYWGLETMADRFDKTVEAHPDKTAIVDAVGRTTFRQLSLMAQRLALGLIDAGVRPGDRVASQLPNRAEAMAAIIALARIGAILVPAVPYYRAAEMEYILSHSEATAAIVPANFQGFDYPEMMAGLRSRLPALRHLVVAGGEAPEGAISMDRILASPLEERYPAGYLDQFRADPNQPLILNYSSGSESAPKAAMMTHNIFLLGTWRTAPLGVTDRDVVLTLAPLHHGFGYVIGGLAPCVCHGATLVFMDRVIPEDALALVQRERVNVIVAVPPQVVSLLGAGPSHYDLSSLRVVTTAGAAANPDVIRQLKIEAGCTYINMWGTTEGGSLMARPDDPPEVIATTLGRPAHPAMEFRILADDDLTELPPGEIGKIAMRGPTVFAGYFKDPERTRRAFNRDGFYVTGDLAYIGSDGNFRMVGRKNELINRGGEKISPLEVEEAILAHPGVAAIAVVAMPDPRLGERACAYVVPRPGAQVSLSDLASFLRGRGLAAFKLPERLEVVESLPMTPSGKVRKNLLRDELKLKLEAAS